MAETAGSFSADTVAHVQMESEADYPMAKQQLERFMHYKRCNPAYFDIVREIASDGTLGLCLIAKKRLDG